MLYRLLRRQQEWRSRTAVISLTEVGPLGEKLAALGIEVVALGMRRTSTTVPRRQRSTLRSRQLWSRKLG